MDGILKIGPFGSYIGHNKQFYSQPKNIDPFVVTFDVPVPLSEEKRKAKKERTIKIFEKERLSKICEIDKHYYSRSITTNFVFSIFLQVIALVAIKM